MNELEKEWQIANDGFSAGIDFKAWLTYRVLAQRAVIQAFVYRNNAMTPEQKEALALLDAVETP